MTTSLQLDNFIKLHCRLSICDGISARMLRGKVTKNKVGFKSNSEIESICRHFLVRFYFASFALKEKTTPNGDVTRRLWLLCQTEELPL